MSNSCGASWNKGHGKLLTPDAHGPLVERVQDLRGELQKAESLVSSCTHDVEASWEQSARRLGSLETGLSHLSERLAVLGNQVQALVDNAVVKTERGCKFTADLVAKLEQRLEAMEATSALVDTLATQQRDQQSLTSLQVRVDALVEGLSAEARLREESFRRLELQCRQVREFQYQVQLPESAAVETRSEQLPHVPGPGGHAANSNNGGSSVPSNAATLPLAGSLEAPTAESALAEASLQARSQANLERGGYASLNLGASEKGSLPLQPRIHSLRLPLEGNQPVPEIQSVAEWSRRRSASMPPAIRRRAEPDVKVEEIVVTEFDVCVPTEEIPISTRGSETLVEPSSSATPTLEPLCHRVEPADGQNASISAVPQRTERALSAALPSGRSSVTQRAASIASPRAPVTQRAASIASPRDSPAAQKPQPSRTPVGAMRFLRNLQRNSGHGSAGGSLLSPSETSATLTPPHSWANGIAPSISGSPHRRSAKPLSPRVRGSRTSRCYSLPHFSAHGSLQDAVPMAMMSSPSRRSATPSCVTGHGQTTTHSTFASASPLAHVTPGRSAHQLQSSPGGVFMAAPPLLPLMSHTFSADHVSQQQWMNGDSGNLFRSASCNTLLHPVQPGCWGLLQQGSS